MDTKNRSCETSILPPAAPQRPLSPKATGTRGTQAQHPWPRPGAPQHVNRWQAILSAAAALSLSLLYACGNPDFEQEKDHGPWGAGESADVGVVQLALEVIPSDLACLGVGLEGPYREATEMLAITGGEALSHTLSGAPLGLVTVTAAAFEQTCESLTARTVPTWVAAPTEISVIAGSKARAELVMRRNGRIEAEVTFPDEPACSLDGVACRSGRECCSGSCKSNQCTSAAAP